MKNNKSKFNLSQLILSIVTIIVIVFFSFFYFYTHNFAEVIPNSIYRSRQLTGEQLQQAIIEYQLKTILNLRGVNPQETWYQNEVKDVQQNHMLEENFALKSKVLPSRAIIIAIANALEHDPKPMLIHCESGVDRTGLVSAMAILLSPKGTLQAAWEQVSIKHYVLSTKSVGRQFLHQYENWLNQQHLIHSTTVFKLWLNNYYTGLSNSK